MASSFDIRVLLHKSLSKTKLDVKRKTAMLSNKIAGITDIQRPDESESIDLFRWPNLCFLGRLNYVKDESTDSKKRNKNERSRDYHTVLSGLQTVLVPDRTYVLY